MRRDDQLLTFLVGLTTGAGVMCLAFFIGQCAA